MKNLLIVGALLGASPAFAQGIRAEDYPSLQAALDANPGGVIHVSNDVELDQELLVRHDGSVLWGDARIIQTNPKAGILAVDAAEHVTIRGLTLTRPQGATVTAEPGLRIEGGKYVVLDSVRVVQNQSTAGSIRVMNSSDATIRNCTVVNYKRVAIDDRTGNPELYGYAFRCIDGTGIVAHYCEGTIIEGNRIVEEVFLPTREVRDENGLGELTQKLEEPGRLADSELWESGYTNNWHQGSGIIVGGLGKNRDSIVRGNYIVNAGQGIDVHADSIIIANNIVDGAMIGMKAMHGSKHVQVIGNQFRRVDLWGILLSPGSASHGADGENEENVDGGSIIANNIISEFGYGGQQWNWEGAGGSAKSAIVLAQGQLPENPPLRNVIVQGNVVYASGADKFPAQAPRHRYALFLDVSAGNKPENVRIVDNLLEPGSEGASNFDFTIR